MARGEGGQGQKPPFLLARAEDSRRSNVVAGDLERDLMTLPSLPHSTTRRPEDNIAVVTHSSFLDATFNSFGEGFSSSVKDEMHRWFDNCEMRTVVVANVLDPLPDDKLHYRGGMESGVGHKGSN